MGVQAPLTEAPDSARDKVRRGCRMVPELTPPTVKMHKEWSETYREQQKTYKHTFKPAPEVQTKSCVSTQIKSPSLHVSVILTGMPRGPTLWGMVLPRAWRIVLIVILIHGLQTPRFRLTVSIPVGHSINVALGEGLGALPFRAARSGMGRGYKEAISTDMLPSK